MPQSEARVTLESPGRYLGQLCKHFAHRLPVTQEAAQGSIAFPTGLCRLEAGEDLLLLRAEAADPAALEQLQDVVARHLLRFAFRAPPEITWRPIEGG
ncbi:DUF2218 domain-containing protein [Belnapia sp. T6]|uniref:DUF2218 domain-containing protein n=1 Tax=Belnapia mucosa TaxID=2804532 RepID=A0ABS1V4J9_9PROT|nr:DUF2218 domain-containing protein [Belnapia mucosa]MBL6456630.1 DUF2218 domain-containing protein [Belnapia mucosa]